MSLVNYASNPLYDQRLDLRGCDFIIGKDTELWVKELDYGTCLPTVVSVTGDFTTNPVVVDDEQITVIAASDVTLYRGDVLKFASGTFVVATTTALPATTGTVLPILPAAFAISADEATSTYGMLPLISVQDGGGLEFSSNDAEARNKIQGVWSARRTISRTATTNVTGAWIPTDEGARLLNELTVGSRNVYAEARYAPFVEFTVGGVTYSEGTGPGAWSFEAAVNLSTTFNGDEFVQINATLNVSGRPVPYTVLT